MNPKVECSNCGMLESSPGSPCPRCGTEITGGQESFTERAQRYVGKTILVGMTYVDAQNKPVEQKQFSGTILRINTKEGVVIRLDDSPERFTLPPQLDQLQDAPPGEYRLRSSGKVITNPDFLATWTVNRPA